ncbi:hypothetical protein Tco_1505095 [Tanacetum coccineum]
MDSLYGPNSAPLHSPDNHIPPNLENSILMVDTSNREWDTPEYHDTADSGKKKEAKAFTFYQMETKEISERHVAPCFVNSLEAYDGEINLENDKNLISNEFAVKLCLEHEVKNGDKVVKKELIVALRGEIYFVKFIINPKEDDIEPGVVLGRSFLSIDFGDIPEIDGLELPPYVCNMGKSSKNKRKPSKNYKIKYDDEGPSLTVNRALTREELLREELEKDLWERIVILNEPRPIIETLKYGGRYKKVLDTILLDKLKLDGELEIEEVEANEDMIREYKAMEEKDDPCAFVLPIRLEGIFDMYALVNTGSNINIIPYHIFEELGREHVERISKKRTKNEAKTTKPDTEWKSAPPPVVEQFNLEEPIENPDPLAPMDDTRTMAQLLEAPTVGYEDAIVVPEIAADNFELKHVSSSTFHPRNLSELRAERYGESFTLDKKNQCSPAPTPSKRLRKVVLLVVVLIPNKLVQPPLAMFIEIIFKNMSLKQPQLTTTKETPVIEPRFQIKFDLPVFLPLKTIIMWQSQGKIRIVTNNQNRGISIKLHLTQHPGSIKFNLLPSHVFVQPPAYQAPAYQAPAPQIQGVSKEDFQAYVKANDAVMRNMQTQGQNMQNQLTNLTDMLSKFLTSNTASTSGTLPSNTVTNPKEDLKGITTRSGVAYKGPTIHTTSSPKVVEREPEVTKDTMPPTNNGSTEDIQPPVVPVVHHESISEPVNAPVSASRPNKRHPISISFIRNDERRCEKLTTKLRNSTKSFEI